MYSKTTNYIFIIERFTPNNPSLLSERTPFVLISKEIIHRLNRIIGQY